MRKSRRIARVVAGTVIGLTAAAAALGQSGAPSRTFGPDTYATGIFTGQGTTAPGLTCDAPLNQSQAVTCDGFLASRLDGTLLDVTVRVPQTTGPHPLVVNIHGWGGSKNAGRAYDHDLTGAGYTYLRYSTRGFGRSWGQANFGDINVEIADLQNLIGQVVDDVRFRAEASAVAVFGASYGGAHSWLAAAQPVFTSPGGKEVTIRTVVPVAAGTDLLYSLIPNGRPNDATSPPGNVKLSYLNGLYLTGIRPPSQARPYPNYPPYLALWHAEVNATEPNYRTPTSQQMVDGIQGYRSVYWQSAFWARVRRNVSELAPQLPIFQIQGFTDDLFPIDESLRMLRALKAVDPNYPIASYFGDIGHPRATNKPEEVRYVLGAVLEWLGYYLKGVGLPPALGVRAAITRPREVVFDPADVVSVTDYDALATGRVSHGFKETSVLTFNPTNTGGFVWDPVTLLAVQDLGVNPPAPPSDEVPGDVAVYEVAVNRLRRRADGLLVAGQPTVTVAASSQAHRVQLNVRLIDVAPSGAEQLVTRGTYTLDTGDPTMPIGTVNVTIVTYGNLWHAAPSNTLRLEITNVDSPYVTPSRIPSVTEISKVRLNVPFR
jgi:pimeloyl-ACP methyl ester carboxylesterase